MSKTRLQVVRRALKELGIMPQTAETYASVDELVDGLVDSLTNRDVAFIPDIDDLDEDLFRPVAQCLAYAAAPEMSIVDPNALQVLGANKMAAEMEMKTIKALRYTRQIAESDYF